MQWKWVQEVKTCEEKNVEIEDSQRKNNICLIGVPREAKIREQNS